MCRPTCRDGGQPLFGDAMFSVILRTRPRGPGLQIRKDAQEALSREAVLLGCQEVCLGTGHYHTPLAQPWCLRFLGHSSEGDGERARFSKRQGSQTSALGQRKPGVSCLGGMGASRTFPIVIFSILPTFALEAAIMRPGALLFWMWFPLSHCWIRAWVEGRLLPSEKLVSPSYWLSPCCLSTVTSEGGPAATPAHACPLPTCCHWLSPFTCILDIFYSH